jgi:hypothetical protein
MSEVMTKALTDKSARSDSSLQKAAGRQVSKVESYWA